MAVSILDVLKEEARQGTTGDTNYAKSLPWVFRIVVEGERFKGPTGHDGTATFPLPIAPERFDYNLPFAQEVTPQQEAGIVAEEAGIVIGDISISATTGWKLRKTKALTFATANPVFTSQLANTGKQFYQEISGQMSFWILANRCFEGYSELKKDPSLAPKTRMELHILKEQLHLEVVPIVFRLHRDAQKNRVTYSYDIQLHVIGDAKPIKFKSLADEGIFDEAKDTITKIKQSVQSISALLQDLTASIGELTSLSSSVVSIVDDLTTIVDSGNALVNGTRGFLNIPSAFIGSTTTLVESTAAFFENVTTVPADVYQTFKNIEDQLDTLRVAARDHYKQSWEGVAERYNQLTATNRNDPQQVSDLHQGLIDQAFQNASDAEGTLGIEQAFGRAFKPGDKARQLFAKSGDRMIGTAYSGFEEIVIGQGDTLQSIAARRLLDPHKWVDIAAINNLRPPFITNGAMIPNTLQIGSKIIIPISKPGGQQRVWTTGDVPFGQSQSEAHLGTDIELVQLASGRYGWAVDVAHGATDASLVYGIENVSQGIGSRLRTNQGENIINPRVGLPRLVGQQQFQDFRSEANLRVRQQLLADPRIERVIKYEFTLVKDALTLDATVQPIGFNTSRVISRTL